jgi:hypothetical protein
LILDLWVGLSKNCFACGSVLPLMHSGVLRSHVEIAQTSLKSRAIIDGIAASQGETRVDYPNASGGNPYSGLRTLDEERVFL